jgi:hypothetical protein
MELKGKLTTQSSGRGNGKGSRNISTWFTASAPPLISIVRAKK